MGTWRPVSFDAEGKREYDRALLNRYIPFGRLAMGAGAFSFVGYQSWDLLLDPTAFEKTAPIRLVTVAHFSLGIGLIFLPCIRTNGMVQRKQKTIGDAHMAVIGLSDNASDHAQRMPDLALGMNQAFDEFRCEHRVGLKLRIGMNSGGNAS